MGIALALVTFSAGIMPFPPVMQAHLMENFLDKNIGGDFGAFKTIYSGIGSLGPLYVGLIASWRDYTTAYLGLACCLLVSGAVILLIYRGGDLIGGNDSRSSERDAGEMKSVSVSGDQIARSKALAAFLWNTFSSSSSLNTDFMVW